MNRTVTYSASQRSPEQLKEESRKSDCKDLTISLTQSTRPRQIRTIRAGIDDEPINSSESKSSNNTLTPPPHA